MADRPDWLPAGAPTEKVGATSNPDRPSWLQTSVDPGRATWATGGQRGSIQNGWNTDYYNKMFGQREEADKSGIDPTSRADFTGIVTYNNVVKDEQGGTRRLKLGDVWEDGKVVENIYDYGLDQANAIMSQLTLDATEQRKLFESAEGDQVKIDAAIKSRASENTSAAEAAYKQQQFVAEREEVEDQWGDAAPAILAIGGAASGAIAGTAGFAATPIVGAITTIGGAVAGAVGALMNQDELIDAAAEAQVKVNRANQLNNPLLFTSTAIGEYAGVAGQVAAPLTNLTVGVAEQINDSVGNDVGAREEAGLRDNVGLEVARFGAGFADAFAQFAGGAGASLYIATMAARTAGGVGTLATGQQWDDRQREFNPIADSGDTLTDVGRWASAIGAVGIDAIQTVAPVSILRAADKAAGASSRVFDQGIRAAGFEQKVVSAAQGGNKAAQTTAKLLGIEVKGQTRIEGGRIFNLDEAGKVVSVSKTPNVTLLAPSEAVGWLSVRANAMLRGAQGKAVTAEDLFNSALQMRELPTVKKALITGFGEANEEVAQSFLENWAGGYQPSLEELARGAASGFITGAGMAAGAQAFRSPSMQGLGEVNAANALIGADLITPEAWQAMTPIGRDTMRTKQSALAEVAKQSRSDMIEDNQDVAFNSRVLHSFVQEATLKQLETAEQSALPAGERMWKLLAPTNGPSDVVRVELQAFFEAMTGHGKALAETNRVEASDALATLLAQVQYLTRRVTADRSLAQIDVTETPIPLADGTTLPAGTNSVEAANEVMRQAFEGNGVLPAPGQTATWDNEQARQGIELVFQRSPADSNGSWVLLRPEIDWSTTKYAPDGGVKGWSVNHAVLKSLSGDFDGDGMSLRSFLNLGDSEEARHRLRLGLNIMTEDGVVLDSYPDELSAARRIVLHPDKDNTNKFIQRDLNKAVAEITDLLMESKLSTRATMRKFVVENLKDVLITGHQYDAKQSFWEALSATEIVERAAENSGQRVLYRINDIWVSTLNNIGAKIAVKEGADAPDVRDVEVAGNIPQSKAKERGLTPGATLFQTASLATTGNDDIRVKQKFNYTPQAAQTLDGETQNQLIEWAQKLYRVLSSGQTQTQAELAMRGNEIEATALQALKDLMIEWNAERVASGEEAVSMADFARVQVPDVDLEQVANGNFQNIGREPISFVQLALRNSVYKFQGRDQAILDLNDGELRRKYGLLANMDMKTAAATVFSQDVMDDLIGGYNASRMGWSNQTLGQVIAEYTSEGKRGRHEIIAQAKMLEDYGTSHSTERPADPATIGDVTGFRVFMDIIETEGNLFITEGDNGLASLNTTAGRQDSSSIDDLEWSASAARQLLLDASGQLGKGRSWLRRKGTSTLTVEQAQELFDLDADFARKVAEVIPANLALTVFTVTNGKTTAPQWFYEFLTEPNKELAAYKLWRGLLIAQMNNEAGSDKGSVSSDRLIALYQHLGVADPSGRSQVRFEQYLGKSRSIREFLTSVNMTLNGDRPPQLAVLRDQVQLNLAFSNGGWNRSGNQSDMRQRIQAMRDQIARSAETLNETIKNEEANEVVYTKLKNRDPEMIRQLEKAIERAKAMPTGTGPKVLGNSLLSMAIGFVGSESEKAKTARGTEGIGYVTMMQQASWGTPLAQLLAGYTSVSETAFFNRPDLLLDAKTFFLGDGTPVEWPGLTVDLVIDLYQDRAMRPMILAALGPTTFDQSIQEGQASLQALTSQSLQTVVADTKEFRAMLSGGDYSNLMRFSSAVDAKAGDNRMLFLALNIFAARTSGSRVPLNEEDYKQWTDDAWETAARLLRAAGQVPKGERDRVRKLLEAAGPKPLVGDPKDKKLSRTERSEASLFTTFFETAFNEELEATLDQDQSAIKLRHERIRQLLSGKSSAQALVEAYRIPKDPALQRDAKIRIWNEAQDRGSFWNVVQGKDGHLARKFLSTTQLGIDGFPVTNNEAEDAANWEALSRALLVYKLGAGAGQVTASPEARATMAIDDADFRMFLGDWDFLYDFAAPVDGDYTLWDSALAVYKGLDGMDTAGEPAESLVEVIQKELFENKDYPLGEHSSTIIQQILNGKNRAVQSPAEPAIGMYGSNYDVNMALAAATRYTTKDPAGQPTRKYTFTSEALQSRDRQGVSVPLTQEDAERERSFGEYTDSLAVLQGRFVSSFKAFDKNGTEIDFSASLTPPTLAVTVAAGTRDSGYRVMNPSQILKALNAKGVAGPVTIEVEFFHPNDKPAGADWANNVYYDGVPSGHASDAAISLVATDQLNNGQTQLGSRRALDALKKAKAALINPQLPSRASVKENENVLDMAATVNYKVREIMNSDASVSLLSPSSRNRVMKQIKVQTVVRGIDTNGLVQVYTADEIIAHQAMQPGTLPAELSNAEVVTIPIEFIRDMLGEQSTKGTRFNLDAEQFTLEVNTYDRYTGHWDRELLNEKMPGLLKPESFSFSTQAIKDSVFAKTAFLKVARPQRLTSHRELKEYMGVLDRWSAAQLKQGISGRTKPETQDKLRKTTENAFGQLHEWETERGTAPSVIASRMQLPDMSNLTDASADRLQKRFNSMQDEAAGRAVYEASDTGAMWILDYTSGRGPNAGYLRNVQDVLYNAAASQYSEGFNPIPGDVVLIDPGQDAFKIGDVFALVEAGYGVQLSGPQSSARQIAQVKEELYTTGRVSVNSGTWRLRDPRKDSQTAAARESALLAIRRQSTRRYVGVFADQDLPGEQAALALDPGYLQNREVWIGRTLVQSNAFPGFSRPATQEAIAAVNTYLDRFAEDVEGWSKYLAKLGKTTQKEIQPFVEAAIANHDRATGLPMARETFPNAPKLSIGDFVFLVDGNGQVIITRHGHKALTMDDNGRTLAEQLATTYPNGKDRVGIAMFTGELDDSPTFYEGYVQRWRTATNGLAAEMQVPLSALSDKMIFTDDGLKIFASPAEGAGYEITKLQVSQKIPLSYAISLEDHVSKEGRAMDNPADLIAFVGLDVVEAYARTLFGVDQAAWDAIIRERDTNNNPGPYQELHARVTQGLREYQKSWQNVYATGIEAQGIVSTLAGDLAQADPRVLELVSYLPEDTQKIFSDTMTNASAEARVTLAALAYLGTPGAQVTSILTSAGVNNPSDEVVWMPELFTNLFRQVGQGDAVRDWFVDRINDRLPHRTTPKGFEGYVIRKNDLMMEIYTPGKPKRVGLYSFKEAHSTGSDNGEIFTQSFEHSTKQGASPSLRNMAVLALYGADAGHTPDLRGFKDYLDGRPFDSGTETGLSEIFKGLRKKYIAPANKSTLYSPAENLYEKIGAYNVAAFSQPFDQKGEERGWNKDTRATFDARATSLMREIGLDGVDPSVLHGWIRRMLWRPKEADATEDMAEYGHVSYKAAWDALGLIEQNLRDGRFPTWQADVPIMHADEVSLFIQAYERTGRWIPDPFPFGKDPKGKDFDPRTLSGPALKEYFYESALGEALESSFSSLNQNAVDGFLHTYKAVFDGGGTLPLSTSVLQNLQLLDPDFNNIVLALDPNYRSELKTLPLDDTVDMRVSNVFGGTLLEGRYARTYLGKDEIAKAQIRQRNWKEERNIADSYMQGRDISQRGHVLRVNDATTNAAMRVLMNFRLANGMFHPWLFLSAPLETAVRNTFENAVNILTGDSFGKVGQLQRTIDDRIRASAFGQTSLVKGLQGGVQPTYNVDQLIHAQSVVTSLSHNPESVAVIHADLYEDQKHRGGRFERFTERMVRTFGKWQDPSYGITPHASAQRIVGAVMKHFDAVGTENGRTIDDALTTLGRSITQFRREYPVAYALALNSLANARTVKSTSFSIFARSIIDPLSNHNSALVNIPSNLMLKIPFAFQNYAFNVMTNMLGLQGVDAMLALALQGKQSGKAWGRTQAWLSGNAGSYDARIHGVDYLGNVLESVNFADAFIRAGMTHTALAGLGLVLGGLAGGDDEEKKRRRREEMLGVGHVYDPRDFQNDWRNADAIYLDGIPFLEDMFKVTGQDGETHSPAELHWTLKQFISPIVGISKFMNTGNFNHIFWGFGDALGSMPLVNSTVGDAIATAGILFGKSLDAERAVEQGGDQTLLAGSMQFFLDGVARLERQLFENAFINSVYVAADKYDRDPWTLQDIDADGIIQRDNLNQPMETSAMNEYLDDEGNMALGTDNRDQLGGQLRQYSERRATLAFFGSLITGFDSQNTLWRYNMAPREFELQKQETTQDEAAAFILSEWNGDHEVLNVDGAEAFLKSIHAGYIKGDSQVLDNIYITFDQRVEVGARLEAQYRQSQIDLGLTTEEVDRGWNDIMFGSDDTPWVEPLFDVIWSKGTFEGQIPMDPTTTYRQLNTTWVLGPDGKPWATGITRGELYNFFGQAPLNAYSGAGEGTAPGNLGTDTRLNSTDETGNVNTGMRSLEKVNRTTANPTDEDILKAINDASDRIRDAIKGTSYSGDGGGYNRYYGGGYGGGGGGGGSSYANWTFMPFQNDMKSPYIDNIPGIYINDPNVKRASVRRQRFSSERGRLNQWQ